MKCFVIIGKVIRYIWQIFYNAIRYYIKDAGSAFASHLALSGLMALFPFLIFATSLAGFIGARKYTQDSVRALIDMVPENIAGSISHEIINVLTNQRGGVLTISLIFTAYFASNGVEALRAGLNRAYRVHDNRSFFYCRFQSLFFILIGTIGLLTISFLLVLAPLIISVLQDHYPALSQYIGTIRVWRYAVTVVILFIALFIAHKWLPAGQRKFSDILPGIILTFVVWIVSSMIFAFYLTNFAHYVSTYAGLASIMIALIFTYLLSAIFIFGAEFNAAIMFYRNRPQQPGQTVNATAFENDARDEEKDPDEVDERDYINVNVVKVTEINHL